MAGETSRRGYGSQHQKARRYWRAQQARGGLACSRCGVVLEPHEDADLDHTDDRRDYRGLSHVRCNRATGTHRVQREGREPLPWKGNRGRPRKPKKERAFSYWELTGQKRKGIDEAMRDERR